MIRKYREMRSKYREKKKIEYEEWRAEVRAYDAMSKEEKSLKDQKEREEHEVYANKVYRLYTWNRLLREFTKSLYIILASYPILMRLINRLDPDQYLLYVPIFIVVLLLFTLYVTVAYSFFANGIGTVMGIPLSYLAAETVFRVADVFHVGYYDNADFSITNPLLVFFLAIIIFSCGVWFSFSNEAYIRRIRRKNSVNKFSKDRDHRYHTMYPF